MRVWVRRLNLEQMYNEAQPFSLLSSHSQTLYSHIIHDYRLHSLATVQTAVMVGLWNEWGNKQQVSHTYSVTGMQPIKQLAVIRAQQLGLTWTLAAAHSEERADIDTDRNHSHRCEMCPAGFCRSVGTIFNAEDKHWHQLCSFIRDKQWFTRWYMIILEEQICLACVGYNMVANMTMKY